MSKCWYCNEELLFGNNTEHIGICDKCYDEMFKMGDEFIGKLTSKISDLEAKLAESEKENRDLEDDHNKLIEQYNKQYNDLCKEIKVHSSARERFVEKVKELEQQLAEKQSKIQELNDKLEWKSKWLKITDNMVGQSNQDKILFCIEQLEKLKEKVICGVMDISNDFWDCFVRDGSSYMTSENLYDALEQEFTFQIQELKKELNNKETKPKLIKKTLSITSELNEQAEDLGINFSHILREALKKEIKQLKERK